MISLEHLRQIEPALEKVSDEELTVIRNLLYEQGQLAFECWLEEQSGSKNPPGVYGLPNIDMQN